MNARFRAADGKGVAHVHTLNGSGGRWAGADRGDGEPSAGDGSIRVPEVLWPYVVGTRARSSDQRLVLNIVSAISAATFGQGYPM